LAKGDTIGQSVESHYTVADLGGRILSALENMGKDLTSLTVTDLALVDEFHIRGREATQELAEIAKLAPDLHVLDVGSGLGGSARYLAHEYDCRVTGIDLTEDYCRVATMLSQRLGMDNRTEFRTGSALNMPFADGTFDLAWTEHVQMNIEDKKQFYSEIFRALKPGGRMVFHDVFQGQGGEVHFPVPWAEEASISFLDSPDGMSQLLSTVGFSSQSWANTTDISRNWFQATSERMKNKGPLPLGLHVLMGDNARDKFGNMLRNLQEDRIAVIQAVFLKSA